MGAYFDNPDGTKRKHDEMVLAGWEGITQICPLCEKPLSDQCEVILVGRKDGNRISYNSAHIECVRGKDGT